jgi:hypothetical protein
MSPRTALCDRLLGLTINTALHNVPACSVTMFSSHLTFFYTECHHWRLLLWISNSLGFHLISRLTSSRFDMRPTVHQCHSVHDNLSTVKLRIYVALQFYSNPIYFGSLNNIPATPRQVELALSRTEYYLSNLGEAVYFQNRSLWCIFKIVILLE